MESELEKLEIKLKQSEINKTLRNFGLDEKRIVNDKDKTLIDKISSVRWLLESITIDVDKTILGSEPILKQTFDSQEQKILKDKLFNLVKQL